VDIDLIELIEGVRLDLVPLIESTQAQLLVEVAECPGLRFATKTLRSIVYNLLSNAIKYRAPQRVPVVQVRSRCSADHFVLEVQDNGLGLGKDQQAKLFTLFKRLHTHVEGSGVGLYMIKRLIENAGGTITVHSQYEVGSTFTVTLPRA
jgi:signal transduction histidine kinase